MRRPYVEIRDRMHVLLKTVCVSRRQLERPWGRSFPITGLCEYFWGVSHPTGRSSSPTCSSLDKIWSIHADVPPEKKGISIVCIKTWRTKSLTKFDLTPLDVHTPRQEVAQHYSQRHARLGRDPVAGTWQALGTQQSGPRAVCAQCPALGTTHKYGGRLG